jgi:hypothetical protein
MPRLPAALLALMLLAGCGGAVNPLAAAIGKTSKSEGVRVTMTGDVSVSGVAMKMTGEGEMDIKGLRSHMTTRMIMPPALAKRSPLGPEIETEQIMTGLVLYMKMPAVMAKSAPGGKQWMKVDLAKSGRGMGIDLQQMMQGGGTDPAWTLKWLKASQEVEEVGSERIGGVETTHYKADVVLEDLADGVPEDDRAAYRKSIEQMRRFGMAETIPMEVWISDDDLVRRLQYVITQGAPGGNSMRMDLSIDFHRLRHEGAHPRAARRRDRRHRHRDAAGRQAAVALVLRRRDEDAVGADGLDYLDLLFLFEAAVVVGLGVAADAHHAGGDLLVADHAQAADVVALFPAHPLEVEPVEVDLGGLAAVGAGAVVGLLGLADGLHVLRGRVEAHDWEGYRRGR